MTRYAENTGGNEMNAHTVQVDDSGMLTKDVRSVFEEIEAELERALQLHPGFPADPIHQVAVAQEEMGEAGRAVLQSVYEGGAEEEVDEELVQTAAMCVRALLVRRLQRKPYQVVPA